MSLFQGINRWLVVGGISGLLAVVCGAFGAHGMESAIPKWYGVSDLDPKSDTADEGEKPQWYRLDQMHQKKLRTWITGVRYHFYHALAIIAVGLVQWAGRTSNRWMDVAAWLFLLGTIGFSGSIYLLVITKVKILGMTAALGGVIYVVGWLFFVMGASSVASHPSSATATGSNDKPGERSGR